MSRLDDSFGLEQSSLQLFVSKRLQVERRPNSISASIIISSSGSTSSFGNWWSQDGSMRDTGEHRLLRQAHTHLALQDANDEDGLVLLARDQQASNGVGLLLDGLSSTEIARVGIRHTIISQSLEVNEVPTRTACPDMRAMLCSVVYTLSTVKRAGVLIIFCLLRLSLATNPRSPRVAA